MNYAPTRKRWDELRDMAGPGEPGPPYPMLLSDAIWLVFRIALADVAAYVPTALKISPSLIGVLGIFEASSGSWLTPFARSYCAVAVEGHDLPDTREALYIMGDVVTARAAETMRTHYVASSQVGEIALQWEDGLLCGKAGSKSRDWFSAALRPTGTAQPGVTGADAYVSLSTEGLTRHIVSYFGSLTSAEIESLNITDDAPAPFKAFRNATPVLALRANAFNVTWGRTEPLELGPISATRGPPGDPVALLRSVGLTPAEARLAALVGQGSAARGAALQLGISENTARSTLKQVYGKLGIRKQAELGHFIASLQFGSDT